MNAAEAETADDASKPHEFTALLHREIRDARCYRNGSIGNYRIEKALSRNARRSRRLWRD